MLLTELDLLVLVVFIMLAINQLQWRGRGVVLQVVYYGGTQRINTIILLTRIHSCSQSLPTSLFR